MALDFPSSPTNNQVYENYIYSATSGAWQKLPGNTFATTAISDTPPVNPVNGDLWWSSADGKFYIYYSDGSSAQWVSAALPAVAVSDTPPAGYDGQMWLDSTDGSMYVYYTDPGGASSSWIGAVSRSGGVLQVLSTRVTSEFLTTSATPVELTGFTLDVTPRSTSSKILVMFSLEECFNPTAGSDVEIKINRGSTEIAGEYTFESSNASDEGPISGHYLDSPSTSSTVTYKLTVRANGGTARVRRGSFTVMEVAG